MSYGGGYGQQSYGQQPYGQPPPQQYPPPQGHSPYPQQPPHQPPPMNYQQGGYPPQGPPGGQYPPQQGGYAPQQQGYPPPPQGHSPYPQHQQGGYPPPPGPPQGYPPQGQAYAQQQPPPGQYGAPPSGPPPQQYGTPAPYSQPTPPSLGYDPNQMAQINTSADAEALYKAMKGFGTDEKAICGTFARIPDPIVMKSVRQTYSQKYRKDLLSDLAGETSGYFGETCEAVVRGPLEQDAHQLNDAIKGAGTKEDVLNDILLGRSNADMHAIKNEYQRVYRRSLEQDLKGDLSAKTEQLFVMVVAARRAEESAPVMPQNVEHDVSEVHRATSGSKLGTDQTTVCQMFATRSDGQLRAISQAFQHKYHTSLMKVIEKEFTGHMEDALMRMLSVAEDRAMADAQRLEAAMAGPGTKDRLLLNRVTRIHWNRDHMNQVKGAYKHRYKKDLVSRVKGETSGHFERILVALIG